ncbi:MAG: ATP-binding protein, partial [Alphaproteobacteria bacterium]
MGAGPAGLATDPRRTGAALLRALADDGTLRHDAGRSAWAWTAGTAALLPGGDTVTDLLVVRLRRLPAASRNAVRLLACIGNGADDRLLASVAGLPPAAVQAALAPAAAAGLVLHGDAGGWVLVHDRVQEAAYGLTPKEDRPAQHAAIASAMLALWPDRGPEELFRIAAQIELSFGAPLCAGRADDFAGTLIDAAGQAVAAAARGRALTYLAGSGRILGEERWTRSYPLAWRTAVLTAECQLASGDAAGADRSIDGLFRHADGAIDGAEAYRLKAARLTVASDFRGAVRVALDGLALLGIDLPTDPPPGAVAAAYDEIKRLLNGRPVSALADLPAMDDPRMEAAMALLTALEAAFFYKSGDLLHLYFARMVELTLMHGVTAASAQGIAWFGVSLATVFDKYEEGFAFASAALEMVDRHGFERYRTPVLVALDQVGPWTQPLSYGLGHVREAKRVGHRSAELRMLCYSCNHIVSDLLAMGERLSAVREETEPLIAIARDAGFDDIVDLMSTQREYVLSLQEDAGQTVGAWEAAFLDPATAPGRTPMSALYFWTWQLRGQAALYHRDFALARASLTPAFGMTWAVHHHFSVGELTFYNAVLHTQDPGTDPAAARDEVAHCRRRLALWAGINPPTFRNKLALVDAETARLDGRDVEAMRLYDDSAAAAAAAGFSHEQALAHELAGRHARSLQLGYAARDQLRLAMAAYRRWGALAKVKGLEAEFPFLAADGPADARHGIEDPDMELVLKTAHALSEEILLDRLVERLMVAMIVHAGARRGVLLLMRGDEPRVEATATLVDSDIVVRLTDDVPAVEQVPAAVLRTRRTLSSGDAATAGGKASSFLCQPLIKQGRLVGVLYLENDLALNVFTPRKAAMLEVLAPQAANALEATRLYTDLMLENRRRQEMEAALRVARADLARASHLTVMGELAASITHEISQPLAGIVASAGASLRWLKAPTPDVAEALSNLEDIRTAGLRVADILRALRSLAKQAPLVLEPLSVDPLVEEVLTLTADEIGKRGVRLTADLRSGGVQVRGDRTQLQQVVLNLVTDALDSMAGDGGQRELLVASRVVDGVLAVSVCDTGSGISTDILARIFDPFFTT